MKHFNLMSKRHLTSTEPRVLRTVTVTEKEKEHSKVWSILHDKHIAIHCIGITFMYICQGLVQGTIGIIPLVIISINKDFPAETIAALGLPIYAFSLKFLWAPIVDLLYVKRWYTGASLDDAKYEGRVQNNNLGSIDFAHRRLQWVTVAQLVMSLGYLYLYFMSFDSEQKYYTMWTEVAMGERSYWPCPLLILFILAFASSTQDVAVDAWAVEGLPSSMSNLPGTLQMIGLTIGISLSSFFLYLHTENSIDYPLSSFLILCSFACSVGVLFGFIVAIMSPLHTLHSACEGSVKEIVRFLRTPSVKDIIVFLLARGVVIGGNSLASLELVRLDWMTPNELSTLSLMSTGISLLSAAFLTPIVIRRCGGPMDVLRYTTMLSLPLQGIFVVIYVCIAKNETHASKYMQWLYFYAVMIPNGVCGSLLGSVTFVCVSSQFAKEVTPFPNLTGTAVTILNSFSNMGFAVPSSVVMFSVSFLKELIGVDRTIFSMWAVIILFILGAVLQHAVLLPAIRRLQLKP